MITKSAILINGKIFVGDNHRDIIHDIVVNKRAKLPLDGEQGFLNDKGRFLSREDAAIEALDCGQIKELRYCTTRLFSEDLLYSNSYSYQLLKTEQGKKQNFFDRAYSWITQLNPIVIKK